MIVNYIVLGLFLIPIFIFIGSEIHASIKQDTFWVDFISNILTLAMMACGLSVIVLMASEPSWWIIPLVIGTYMFSRAEEKFKKIISDR